jgi:uncharacterized membrane protein
MKILKPLLIAIAVLIAIPLIAALFMKNEFNVSREITIEKSKQEVWDYTKYLKNQNEWSVWASMDPNMKVSFTGEDGTVGFVSAWESPLDSVGKGEQEITKIDEGKRIDYELRFLEPMAATNYAFMTFDSLDVNQTKVTWGFSGKMPYPMNAIMLVVNFDEMLGKDFSQGLANLKSKLESNE